MRLTKHIPNFLTLCNLFCGCVALVMSFSSELNNAALFVGIAMIFDFFDGFAARLLHVSSAIGKELDSLADMVSFGVVPGIIMFHMLKNSLVFTYGLWNIPVYHNYVPYLAFLIPLFSAIRLAKFNLDTRQTNSFIGLPTPANAIFICSLPVLFMTSSDKTFLHLMLNPIFLVSVSVLMSLLLIAEIPLFALKFKNFSVKDNKIRYLFLVIVLISFMVMRLFALPFLILIYIILSLFHDKVNAKF